VNSPRTQWSVLTAHPHTAGPGVYGIAAEVRFIKAGVLFCDYTLHADLDQVRLPQAGAGARMDELWRHTCFEAFIAAGDTGPYFEFNFSPSGDWAAYRFSGYRAGMEQAGIVTPPQLRIFRGTERLELSATVDVSALPELAEARTVRVGLNAVVEDAAGGLSYWALRHTAGKPDFHHADGFVVELNT
jgi:hypothetical protein